VVLSRIGLTGATGMLGRHLRAALDTAGAETVAVSRPAIGSSSAAHWNLEQWRSHELLDAAFAGVQAVIHAAAVVHADAPDDARMFDVNVRATVNLAGWAASRGIPIVFISSSAVYAQPEAPLLTEDSALGSGPLGGFYAVTKLLAEDALARLASRGLLRAVVRPSSLYGAGLPSSKTVNAFLEVAGRGGVITVKPPEDDRVNMVHAADVSLAVLAILRADAWDTFNVASDHAVSMLELAQTCVAVAGCGSVNVDRTSLPPRAAVTRFCLDTTRAQHRLGWTTTIPLHTGLAMVLEERVQ
jgi:nucleoside-diphosphate-sugar epimerase